MVKKAIFILIFAFLASLSLWQVRGAIAQTISPITGPISRPISSPIPTPIPTLLPTPSATPRPITQFVSYPVRGKITYRFLTFHYWKPIFRVIPAANVNVEVRDNKTNKVVTTVKSDHSGNYVVSLKEGSYTLRPYDKKRTYFFPSQSQIYIDRRYTTEYNTNFQGFIYYRLTLNEFKKAFGSVEGKKNYNANYDADNSGSVNILDFSKLREVFSN